MMHTAEVFPALAGRIEQVLLDAKRVAERAGMLLDKARQSGDQCYLDGVALNLHGFYAAVESCFEDIARTVDGALPSGKNWHQELLRQMGAELKGVRPAVISLPTRDCLDEYRAFRHLVRNVYTFNLRPERVAALAEEVLPCHEQVQRDVDKFKGFLIAMAEMPPDEQ
ncbi:hypothetical protein [Desulfonatronum thioautotrophicum]|uniref:ribonuclease toxin HepT-like protein n=1 Tax=Desulfonatronum thioautotrophicum TaxID=617001 RepID=UPI0005EB480D|nr:hypothetical protein [Desulfonatronum thioautotrophicum]